MAINLENIDYVFYVDLGSDLLPKKIYKVSSKEIEYITDKRVSFTNRMKLDYVTDMDDVKLFRKRE